MKIFICYQLLPKKVRLVMTADQYLMQIEVLDTMIQQDIEQLEELKVRARGVGAIRYDKDKVQTSPSDRLCGDVCSIVTMEQRINDEIDQFYDAKQTIIKQIRGIRDPNLIQILYKRYVQYKTLKAIAMEMKIGYTTVLAKHQEALAQFEANNSLEYII